MVKIVAPSPKQKAELYDLVAKVFPHPGYFDFLHACYDGYFEGATYDWSASRVAIDGGKIIAHVGVWDYQMRVGSARLRTGGIGAVLTHPDHRKKGLGSEVFWACMAAMRQAGYQYSLLFGIWNYYHRFGFAQAWPNLKLSLETDAPGFEPVRLTAKPVELAEALTGHGAVMDLYNRQYALVTGSAERPLCALHKRNMECHTLSRGRKVVGYLVTRPGGDAVTVFEAAAEGPALMGQVLAAARALAIKKNVKRIVAETLSYTHPLCQLLRGMNCRVEMQHVRSGGAMGATVNLRSSLELMRAELSARLARSAMKDYQGLLVIEGQDETVTLNIADGGVDVLAPNAKVKSSHRIVAGPATARLLIGATAPSELILQSDVRFTGDALPLAEILFPAQWPMLCQLDGF
jgi:predicted N-acetyltransferase YhbS